MIGTVLDLPVYFLSNVCGRWPVVVVAAAAAAAAAADVAELDSWSGPWHISKNSGVLYLVYMVALLVSLRHPVPVAGC